MKQSTSKILIISATTPPDRSATAILIEKLLPCFQAEGIQVEMLTVKGSFSDPVRQNYGKTVIHRADCFLYGPLARKCLRDVLYLILRKIGRFLGRKDDTESGGYYKAHVTDALEAALERLPMDSYDAVIAVCAYYDAAEALRRYMEKHRLRGRAALYQVDPLSENKIYLQDNESQLRQYEKNLYEKLDHVFTTPLICRAKQKLGWDLSHVTALEFPMKAPEVEQVSHRTDRRIHCVFAGYLYGALRDATYTLDLFSKMEDPNIHLSIIGWGQEELLRTYEKGPLQGRLHLLGEKTPAECDELLRQADVLVNIGNTVSNQVPSKLLHYFSFGKPILNIVACDECPSLPYIQKYPVALSVRDSGTADEPTAVAVEQWLRDHGRCSVPSEQILRIFEECTPEHIAGTMMDHLNIREVRL